MTIESFKLNKKFCFGKITIKDSHRIMFIKRSNQPITSILYGLHVPGCYIAACSYQRKIFHHLLILLTLSFCKRYFSPVSSQLANPCLSKCRRCPCSLIQPICLPGLPTTKA